MIKYPTVEGIIEINKKVLEEIKVRKADRSKLFPSGKEILESIITKMKTKKGDVYGKAVILLKELIRKHPFESGNRRTAFVSVTAFLKINSKKINITHNENILQGIRERYYNDIEIKKWLRGGKIREFKRSIY